MNLTAKRQLIGQAVASQHGRTSQRPLVLMRRLRRAGPPERKLVAPDLARKLAERMTRFNEPENLSA